VAPCSLEKPFLNLDEETWTLTTIYGPCTGLERQDFINWLNGLNIDDDCN
jgi:hypothetical protein